MSSTLVRRSCAVALPAHDTGCLGFCDLVFRGLSGTAATGAPPPDALMEPVASCDAAFSCLLQLGGRAAGYGAGEVQFRNVVNGETLSISRLIELADELGIKAEHVQPDWHSLQTPGFSYPTLAVLKNANVVVLTGVGRGEGSEVAVWDPLNPHEEILSVPRADFERAWTGHALIITARASSRAVISRSSDFCWFTSAGLELLGKPPAKGRNPEASSHDDKEAGTRSTARRGRTRRSAAATSAGPALARSEIANGLPPAAFADGTPLATPPPLRRAAERKLSLPARSCIAAGVLIAVAGGAFLLSNSATDPVAAALALANEVWAVAPSIAPSNEHAPPNDSARIAQSARPTGAAPIPAPLPATSASDTGATPPAAAPAIKTRKAEWHAESTAPSAGVAPATLSAEPTAPSAGVTPATPSAEPTAPSAGVAPPTPSAGPTPPSAEAAPATPPAEPTASGLAAPPATLPAEPTAPSARVMPVVPLVAGGAPGPAAAPAAPSPAPSAMELDSKTAAPPAATNGSSLSADEMAALLARGDMLLSVGDVASARLFYERAADAGGGLAAIRLGETFDPLFLDRVRLSGVRGDPAVAASWYRRARTSARRAPQCC